MFVTGNRPRIGASVSSLQERVRAKLKALVEQQNVSHERLGDYLGLTRSAVTRLLNDEGGIGLQHIERLCEFFQVTAAEMFADPHQMIHALTPIEASLLRYFREMTELERRSWLTILERPRVVASAKSRMGRAMLTAKEQELVDLFARVKKDGVRDGVLKVLRGAVNAEDGEAQGKPRTTG
jgi:transcriptional regulator with XRE-family HTH domain